MSRCFLFPPPGYTLSNARKEIMSELIKLHEEKQQKEEKRREKKERRKERREIRKNKKDKTNLNLGKSDIVKGHIGQQVCSDFKDEYSQKRREAKGGKFELSSLTEEHGRPNSLPVPSSSCDSTENTSNRKKRASPEDDSHGHSKAILIRLPSLMETDLSTGLRKRPEICNIEGINLRSNGEEICSNSGQIEAGKTIRSMSDDAVNPMQGVELLYKDLLENWLPPQLQDTGLYTVDSDWLFGSNREKRDEKRQRCGSGGNRAEYLPEVGAFALPFVVPY